MAERARGRSRARRRSRVLPAAGSILLLAGLVLLPVPVGDRTDLLAVGQHVLIGVVGGLGLTVLVGQAGRLSLAHPLFLLVGAVGYAVLAGRPGERPGLVGLGLPTPFALLGAVVLAGLVGLAAAPLAGRLDGTPFALASLAVLLLGLWSAQSLVGLTGGPVAGRAAPALDLFGFPIADGQPAPALLGVPLQRPQRLWYLFLALAVLAYLLARGAVRSRVGRAWRAVRDGEAVAVAMGVSVWRVRSGAFVVSAAFAGLAGVMTALRLDRVTPGPDALTGDYSLTAAFAWLAVVLLAGRGSLPGTVLGAAVVFGLPQLALLGLGPVAARAGPAVAGLLDAGVLTALATTAAIALGVLVEHRRVYRRADQSTVDR